MVSYLLDTDILIDFINAKNPALDILDKIGVSSIAISTITLAEFLEGLLLVPEKKGIILRKIKAIPVLDLDSRAANIFAEQRFELRKSGKLIDNMDLLIASTALVYKLILVTNNKKDFGKIKGLKLYF